MRNKTAFIILFTIVIVYFIISIYKNRTQHFSFNQVDIEDFQGRKVSLDAFQGKYVLIDVYGTWCIDCIKSLPGLLSMYEVLKKEGWEVVGLNNDEISKTEEFIKHRRVNFPCFHLVPNYKRLGIYSIPTYFVLDRQGHVVFRSSNQYDWTKEENIDMLRKIALEHE